MPNDDPLPLMPADFARLEKRVDELADLLAQSVSRKEATALKAELDAVRAELAEFRARNKSAGEAKADDDGDEEEDW